MTALMQDSPVDLAPSDAPPAPGPRVGPGEPDRYLQLRQPLDLTLGTLLERLSGEVSDVRVDDVPTREIQFHLGANPGYIEFVGDRGRVQVPATRTATLAFGDLLGVPTKFLDDFATDCGPDAAQFVLERRLQLYGKSALTITYGDAGIVKVAEAGRRLIDVERIVTVAANVLHTEDAPVVRLIDTSQEFGFDVHVPFDYDQAVGGDKRVGDLTAGGVRFGYKRKRNLAPSVQSFLFRQVCTNGMSHVDPGLKIDSRGLDVDRVMAELEFQADRAFSRVESQIKAFYDLRGEPAPNPERSILAIAEERGIPQRTTSRLLSLASTDALPDHPTRFDVLNLITNTANDPSLLRNDGGRLILENAAGAEIAAHEARCRHCDHKVRD